MTAVGRSSDCTFHKMKWDTQFSECRDGVERVLPALPARRLQRCGVVRAVVEQHRVRAVDGRGDGQRHEREERVVRRAQRLEA